MNIKELAEQAGFFPSDNYDHSNWHAAGFSKNFERFAELVAAAERKYMMQLFTDPENQPTQYGTVRFDCIKPISEEKITEIVLDTWGENKRDWVIKITRAIEAAHGIGDTK